jgi:hypothetical protein
LEAGMPCSLADDCSPPLRCTRLLADTIARCTSPGAVGAPCASAPGDSCQYGAVCLDGGCVAAGSPGQPCARELFGCFSGACQADGGAVSQPSDGTCGPLLPTGASCRVDAQCQSTWCHPATSTCAARCP